LTKFLLRIDAGIQTLKETNVSYDVYLMKIDIFKSIIRLKNSSIVVLCTMYYFTVYGAKSKHRKKLLNLKVFASYIEVKAMHLTCVWVSTLVTQFIQGRKFHLWEIFSQKLL